MQTTQRRLLTLVTLVALVFVSCHNYANAQTGSFRPTGTGTRTPPSTPTPTPTSTPTLPPTSSADISTTDPASSGGSPTSSSPSGSTDPTASGSTTLPAATNDPSTSVAPTPTPTSTPTTTRVITRTPTPKPTQSSSGSSSGTKGLTHRVLFTGWPTTNYTYFVGEGITPLETYLTNQLTNWQLNINNDFFSYNNVTDGTPLGYGSIKSFRTRAEAWSRMKEFQGDGRTLTFIQFPEFYTRAHFFPSTAPYSYNDITVAFIYDFSPVAAVVPSSNSGKNILRDLNDFISLCKLYPGEIVTGGGPSWSVGYIAAFNFMRLTGLNFKYQAYDNEDIANSALLNNSIALSWVPVEYVTGDSRFTILAQASQVSANQSSGIRTFFDYGISMVEGIWRGVGVPSNNADATIISQLAVSFLRTAIAYQAPNGVSIAGVLTTVYWNNRIPYQSYSSTGFEYQPLLSNGVDSLMAVKNVTYALAYSYVPPPPPGPTVLIPYTVDSKSVYGMLSLGSFGLVLTGLGSYAFYYHRGHPVFIAASLPFCSIMIFGFVVGYVSMILLSLDPTLGFSSSTNTNICRSFPVLFGLSFNLIFGALFAKTWRLVNIFYNKALVLSKNITDSAIARHVGLLILVEIIFHACWLSIDPLNSTHVQLDNTHYTYSCQCDHPWIWMGVFITFKVLIVIIGILLAIKTRNLDSQFNESKSIGFSLYNIFFTALIALPLITLLQSYVTLQYVIMNISIFMCLTLSLGALIVPKVLIALGYDAQQPFSFRKATNTASSNNATTKKKNMVAMNGGMMKDGNSRNNSSHSMTTSINTITMTNTGDSSGVSNIHLLARSGSARGGGGDTITMSLKMIDTHNIQQMQMAVSQNMMSAASNRDDTQAPELLPGEGEGVQASHRSQGAQAQARAQVEGQVQGEGDHRLTSNNVNINGMRDTSLEYLHIHHGKLSVSLSASASPSVSSLASIDQASSMEAGSGSAPHTQANTSVNKSAAKHYI